LGLDNTICDQPKILQPASLPFLAKRILWTGSDYLISGEFFRENKEISSKEKQQIAAFGLCDVNGVWKLDPATNINMSDKKNHYIDLGVAYDGEWIYHFYDDEKKDRGFFWGKSEDGVSQRANFPFFTYSLYLEGRAVNISNITGIFLVNSEADRYREYDGSQIVGKVFYRRLTFPHKEKPEALYLEGKMETVAGQKYALLSWRIDGVNRITVTAPGRSSKLPASGWIAWPSSGSSLTYTIKAKNKSGWLNTSIKID
jgi:hypothetical protein